VHKNKRKKMMMSVGLLLLFSLGAHKQNKKKMMMNVGSSSSSMGA